MPYTPSELAASTTSTPTGGSASWSAVSSPKIVTSPPNGMTANATKAQIVEMTGARKYTGLSALTGRISSLNASLSPSASDCSSPNGPTRFGPTRCCIRATTRRSSQIMNSVRSTPSTNSTTTLSRISQSGSSASSSAVRFGT